MNGTPNNESAQPGGVSSQSSRPPLDWWQDTVECWHRLPNKAFFFGLLAAWIALFQFYGNPILGYVHSPSLFGVLWNYYESPAMDDDYCELVPFLVIILYWCKRKELLALPLRIWWPGMLIVMGALFLHIFGFLIQQQFISIAALIIGLWGLMALAWGREWLRHGFFPFWLFIFSVPLGQYGQAITFPLQRLVSWLTEQCAHLLGVDVIRIGTQLFDPSGKYGYEVAAACSGIRSLTAIFLLATVYSFVIFKSPWKRALLMVLAAPFAVLGNLLRMLMIILVASMGGQSAGNFVHENFFTSLMPYVPAIIGFLLIGRWLERSEERKIPA
ncbi:MAG TPA: exosortase/archaeosortase family protein [Verrucomicrobiae bacterium]|jgi:exosortase